MFISIFGGASYFLKHYLKIIIRDSTFFTLRDFRNGARYGGKKFLDCSFSNCLINNKRRTSENMGIFMYSTL